MKWDDETRNPLLTRDAMPAKFGMVRRLREQVEALEKRVAALEGLADDETGGAR